MEKTNGEIVFCGDSQAYCATRKINTTLGELISAIADAADEAQVDEQDLALITQLVLRRLISQR